MAELALHHLDLVLAGQSAPPNPNLRLSSRLLMSSEVYWYGPSTWVTAKARKHFPECLNELPVLIPTRHAPVRAALDRWMSAQALTPNIVGEFEDSALMSLFSGRGMGVFPISGLGAQDLSLMPGMQALGQTDVMEDIYVIHTHRGRHHPLVQKILQGA
jgi:LysR family transcriptional activator of nhaA